jgi:hypothetical protein
MYSPRIIQQNLEKIEAATGVTLTRYSVGEVENKLATFKFKENGDLARPVSAMQRKFITNEQLLCQLDFSYWAERYGTIYFDGGGVGHPTFWETQNIAMRKLASHEEKMYEEAEGGGKAEGICLVWHKARQLGATMLSRLLLQHRLTLHKQVRGISATVDDDKIQKIYDRDKMIYDNLPFYLKPEIKYDEKRAHIQWVSGSSILYQISSQKYGLGTGEQYDVGHLSELSTWPNPATMVEIDFFPTLPQSLTTLCILESTAWGRGNWWHNFSEDVRHGRRPRWIYIFVPWYAEKTKYRRTPPPDWVPSQLTDLHAKKVYERSTEFVGRAVVLDQEQLYWYETERQAMQRAGQLNFFLTNYCATPEESFQHSGVSAFPPEFLERARLEASIGVPHEVTVQ